ncbi:MAG: endo-1,4-beta-xylanase [candidate division KSB1 bacterium]|nr:endo-1,4-beta-xylanase [candidate division KSB1 bacterium]MDZ7295741.1 endo-1,4-beta-xylanase [candidate division KSB1 bacterium]
MDRVSIAFGVVLTRQHGCPKRQVAILVILASSICLLVGWSAAQPLAEGKSKFLGAASKSDVFRYFDRYFNQITPGNDGKWGSVEGTRGSYNWTNLDKIYNYAVSKGILFKEHTLVWGQQQPGWISSLDSAAQRAAVEEWIRRLGERYPLMALVDVVNEPFHAPPSYKNALGGDGQTGWDWVITAFQLARRYCPPQAKLLINEYNILHSNTQTTNYINLVNLLKERGLIDGIGIQGHYFEFRADIYRGGGYVYDVNTIKANLDRLAAVGLPIYITEFDIDEQDNNVQLQQYQIYFPIFWNHPAVRGITLWGYWELDVWTAHPYTFVLDYTGRERPSMQWLKTFVRSPFPPVLIAPNGQVNVQRNPLLTWHASETAAEYRVQLSSVSTFPSPAMVVDSVVTDTLLQLEVLAANQRYFWRVCATNQYGSSDFSATASFMTGDFVGVQDAEEPPQAFALLQNYPNPFNSTTSIEFSIPHDCRVRLELHNLLGQKLATLADGWFPAGRHRVCVSSEGLGSGVFLYRMKAGNFEHVCKLIVAK